MNGDQIDTSPLIAPAPITVPSEIDLEEGRDRQIPIRICPNCLGTDGGDFIAPCKCKGTSKYVHRMRLDHYRAVKDCIQQETPISKLPRYNLTGKFFENTSGDQIDTSLIVPAPITVLSEIDLEEGRDWKIPCQICRKTDGGNFLAPCKCKRTSKYGHRMRLDHYRAVKDCIQQETPISKLPRDNLNAKSSENMSGDQIVTSPLIAPAPSTVPSEIDLEEGRDGKIQCRICLETDGGDFIAPCKCRGTSKYVHRKCLDHWRAVKEGYAFSQCTTCTAPYHLKARTIDYRRRQTLKFRFFVTRDILFIFFGIQLVIGLLAYLVYLIDDWQKFWLRLTWGFGSELSFYYICGAILFFALLGLSGCFIACYDPTVRSDPAQPCREFYHSCCNPGMRADYQTPRTIIIWNDNPVGSESCCNESCDCSCSGEGDESGLALLVIMAVIGICLFAVIGIFYSVLVATMVGQKIWQRHYHILGKTMLAKVYVVENVDGKMDGADWSPPPPLKPEEAQELEGLGLVDKKSNA